MKQTGYRFTLFFVWLICVLLTPETGIAQTQQSFSYEPVEIEEDFDINGKMDDPAWAKAKPTLLQYQRQPNDQEPAPVETRVKVLYSTDNLYIGFESIDPEPSRIRANVTDRDGFFGDDYVGVILDTYSNNQQAYEFVVNPLGIQMDATRTSTSEDFSYDALWYSEASITGTGYIAVMKIPFKSFNFPDRDIQNWAIQFIRNYPRKNRYQLSWTNVMIDNPCLLCQSGQLTNIQDIDRSNTVEILPYTAATHRGALLDPSNAESGFDNEKIHTKAGGSISYSPTTNSSLEMVVNPDFSQIETDASQISVNETFALYFSEKRPFFVKGADLFSTRENLYYSRTINNPFAAAKFTRATNRFSIAFLSAYDREAPFIVPGKERSSQVQTNLNAYNNILRGKYNLGEESHIGSLITTRNYEGGHNYVGGVDWALAVAPNYYFRGQAGYSKTKELDDMALFSDPRTLGSSSNDAAFNGEQFGGTLLSAEFSRESKYYNFSFDYESYSPTLQTQTGFINNVDRRQIGFSQGLSYYPDNDMLSQGSLNVSGNWRYDFDGEFQERFMFVRFNNKLVGQNDLNINFLPVNDERFRGQMFRNIYRGTISFSSNTYDTFSFGGSFEYGRNINRSQVPTLGVGYNISADATVKPTPRFRMTLNYNYSKLSEDGGDQTYYSGDIYRLNTRYNFTKRLFARLITEYNSFSEEVQIYPLLYYKANAFTKFYIGMTSYHTDFYDNSANRSYWGFRQTQREFFVKFQYLIRS